MSAGKRRKVIGDFRSAEKAIISNARCLTEGVDVPEVDLVAFMSPRRNHVDIVQATGRAMRKDRAGAKTVGYVLVPLFVKERAGESLEDAIASSDFGEIWDVLNALQDQDGVLADTIRTMREDLGRIGSFPDRAFRDRVEILGPDLPLDLLRRIITTSCVERLGYSWD